jgi:hypothetical protein
VIVINFSTRIVSIVISSAGIPVGNASKAPRVILSVTVLRAPVMVRVCLLVRVIRFGRGSSAEGVSAAGAATAGDDAAATPGLAAEVPSPATTSTSIHEVYISIYEGSTAVSLGKSHTQ